jgi:hypothetical protein
MKIGITSTCEISHYEKSVMTRGSPTTTLREDVVKSMGGDATLPLTLDRCVLVDDAGNERDSVLSIRTRGLLLMALTTRKRRKQSR